MTLVWVLLGTLAASGLVLASRWTIATQRAAAQGGTVVAPTLVDVLIGFVTNFFDALGIGSFATTTTVFRLFRLVPDESIPARSSSATRCRCWRRRCSSSARSVSIPRAEPRRVQPPRDGPAGGVPDHDGLGRVRRDGCRRPVRRRRPLPLARGARSDGGRHSGSGCGRLARQIAPARPAAMARPGGRDLRGGDALQIRPARRERRFEQVESGSWTKGDDL